MIAKPILPVGAARCGRPGSLKLAEIQKCFAGFRLLSLGGGHTGLEAKNPALLSSRDGYLLELTGWTKWSQAS